MNLRGKNIVKNAQTVDFVSFVCYTVIGKLKQEDTV